MTQTPVVPPPATPSPLVAPLPRPAHSRLTGRVLIGAVLLLLLLSGSALAYYLYSNSNERILADAWQNSFVFETIGSQGTLQFQALAGESNLGLDFTSNFSLTTQVLDLDLTYQAGPTIVELGGDLLHLPDGNIYLKVRGLAALISNFLSGFVGSNYDFSLLEDQWLRFDQNLQNETLQNSTQIITERPATARTCLNQKLTNLKNDPVMLKEVGLVLAQSDFFHLERQDQQTLDSGPAYVYAVSFNPEALSTLSQALITTQAWQSFKTCSTVDLTALEKSLTDDSTFQASSFALRQWLTDSHLTLYLDQKTRRLRQIQVTSLSNSATLHLTLQVLYNQPLDPTPPADSLNFPDLITAIQTQNAQSHSTSTDETLIALVNRLALVLQNYLHYYQLYPWGGDPAAAYLYAPYQNAPEAYIAWLTHLIDETGYGLTQEEFTQLTHDFLSQIYVFKPPGEPALSETFVCFAPSSAALQIYAANACLNDSRSYQNFDPCPSETGAVIPAAHDASTGLFQPGNLICQTSAAPPLSLQTLSPHPTNP